MDNEKYEENIMHKTLQCYSFKQLILLETRWDMLTPTSRQTDRHCQERGFYKGQKYLYL